MMLLPEGVLMGKNRHDPRSDNAGRAHRDRLDQAFQLFPAWCGVVHKAGQVLGREGIGSP